MTAAGTVAVVLLLGLIPGFIARRRGNSFVRWWIFGAVLWPAAMVLVFMTQRRPHDSVGGAS